jgi:hypothetical protein
VYIFQGCNIGFAVIPSSFEGPNVGLATVPLRSRIQFTRDKILTLPLSLHGFTPFEGCHIGFAVVLHRSAIAQRFIVQGYNVGFAVIPSFEGPNIGLVTFSLGSAITQCISFKDVISASPLSFHPLRVITSAWLFLSLLCHTSLRGYNIGFAVILSSFEGPNISLTTFRLRSAITDHTSSGI